MTKPSTPTGWSVRRHSPSSRRSSRLARTSMRRISTGGILVGSGCLSTFSTAASSQASPGPCGAELAHSEAQFVCSAWDRHPPRARPLPDSHRRVPILATSSGQAAHATRCRGPWRLSTHASSSLRRGWSAWLIAAHLARMGVTLARPSRDTRAQRPNPAATSCSVEMRRTSCSRESAAAGAWEERARCRSTIPDEASAASWYQAALSTCNVSSRQARDSGAAA
jgi:hypothetical protein